MSSKKNFEIIKNLLYGYFSIFYTVKDQRNLETF